VAGGAGDGMMIYNKPLDTAKKIILEHYEDYDLGIFDTPNVAGDPMDTIYEDDSIIILGCHHYSYFEVFGLSGDDFDRLEKYYNSLVKKVR
jgi:hypothetical protein